jgi:hypothetical protein
VQALAVVFHENRVHAIDEANAVIAVHLMGVGPFLPAMNQTFPKADSTAADFKNAMKKRESARQQGRGSWVF